MKFFRILKVIFWRFFKEPSHYRFFNEDEVVDGIAIGPALKATHLTLHDMMPYACRWRLTVEQIMGRAVDANAIKIGNFEKINREWAITTFQPYKIKAS